MKYVDEFRNKNLVTRIAADIRAIMPDREIAVMEVCGTHTHNFFRFGLKDFLPANLKFISGPGCPVCVSHQSYIDMAIGLARRKDTVILTFGDMLRVPGTESNLEKERACGADVRVVYSALDALGVARGNPRKKIIFLGVGFETTAPTIALSILAARKEKLRNLFFFNSLKLIPPVIGYLARQEQVNIDAFLLPGHVSAVIGAKAYEFIPRKFGISCCIAGFEPVDILTGLYLIVRQIINKKPRVDNQYARLVTKTGNVKAQKIISGVFEASGADWRGFGRIKSSGLEICAKLKHLDARKAFEIPTLRYNNKLINNCRCQDILKGLISPYECKLFKHSCSPDNPIGACMVSQEGACHAYYKYEKASKYRG